MKKLLFCIKSIDVSGGAERVLTLIVNGLVNRGYKIYVLTFDPADTRPFYKLDPNIIHLPVEIGDAKQKAKFFVSVKRMAAIRKQVREIQPHVCVGFMHSMFVLLSLSLIGTKNRILASEHITTEHYKSRKIEKILVYVASLWIEKITVVSSQVYFDFGYFLRRKMSIIHNPIEHKRRKKADVIGTNKRIKTFLSVGRLEEQKDHQLLINAFSLIAQKIPDWKLRIVGEGSLRKKLEAQAAAKGIAEQIEFIGQTKKIQDEYENSQVFVVTSSYESLGLATAEALSHHLPVVGMAQCLGTNVLVESNINGILVDSRPNQAEVLSNVLLELARKPELRESLATGSLSKLSEFSLASALDEWENLVNGSGSSI